jgi:hypothetical protein
MSAHFAAFDAWAEANPWVMGMVFGYLLATVAPRLLPARKPFPVIYPDERRALDGWAAAEDARRKRAALREERERVSERGQPMRNALRLADERVWMEAWQRTMSGNLDRDGQ